MIDLKFESDSGVIRMGGADFFGLKILEVTGLGFLTPERTKKTYNGSYGSRTTNRHIPERSITISGEINSECLNRTKAKGDIIKAAREPGVLTVNTGIKKRHIKAEVDKLSFDTKNPLVQMFTLQFLCEEGLFYSDEESRTISTVTKNIYGTFTLPRVLSYRYNTLTVFNAGDYPIEPVIRIYDIGEKNTEEYSDSIIIKNNTTGSFVHLTKTTEEGEVITVDIAERRINSNLTENDLYCFSDDTVLSDFVFEKGETEFEVINNTNREISCFLEYKELYGECEL